MARTDRISLTPFQVLASVDESTPAQPNPASPPVATRRRRRAFAARSRSRWMLGIRDGPCCSYPVRVELIPKRELCPVRRIMNTLVFPPVATDDLYLFVRDQRPSGNALHLGQPVKKHLPYGDQERAAPILTIASNARAIAGPIGAAD